MLGSVPRSCQREAVPGGRGEEFCSQQPRWLPCESCVGGSGRAAEGKASAVLPACARGDLGEGGFSHRPRPGNMLRWERAKALSRQI